MSMMFERVLLLVVIMDPLSGAHAATYLQADDLVTNMLANYSNGIRPLQNQSGTVDVVINAVIYSISDIDPIKGLVTLAIGFQGQWTDEIFVWNATDYGGIQSVLLEPQQVWTPSITIATSLELTMIGEDNKQRVKLFSNGFAIWSPTHLMKLSCTFYMKFWPFDKQECNIMLIVNDDTVNDVKIHFGNLGVDASRVSMSEWTVEDVRLDSEVGSYVSYISCGLRFKRQPAFYVLTLILPCALLGALIPFVFLLPSDSGERIGFSITILLSLTVFLTVISDEIPRTTNPVALICGYVMLLTLSSVIVTVLTIVNLRFHHNSEKQPVGKCWQMLCGRRNISTRNKVLKLVCNRNVTSVTDIENHELKVSEAAGTEREFNDTGTELYIDQNKIISADDPCSWQDVSKAIDKYLFIVTSAIVTCPSVIFLCYIAIASDYGSIDV